MDAGVTINRPPRDGASAFVKSPDNISGAELLQEGDPLPLSEPWASVKYRHLVGITFIIKGSAMAFQTHQFPYDSDNYGLPLPLH